MKDEQRNELIEDARELATEEDRDYYVVSWRNGQCSHVVNHEQLVGLLPISPVTVYYSTAQDA